MYKELTERVFAANKELHRLGLAPFTWGNASACDRQAGVFAIKPSGVSYDSMTVEDIVVLSLEDCRTVQGKLRPSSDTPTHFYLYKHMPGLGSVVHTHSPYASAHAQAGLDIPVYGTTHADFSHTAIPCTRALTREEVRGDYELNTGAVIAELFDRRGLNPQATPAVLVRSHAPFIFADTPEKCVENAAVLEIIAQMALQTELMGCTREADSWILDKHYLRKHGDNAYYGQK